MLNLRYGKLTMLWPFMFMVRRAVFVVGVCGLKDYGPIQIYFFLVPTLVSMAVLAAVKPLKESMSNRLEVFNSFMILLMIYCLMHFTPYIADPMQRHKIGFGMVILTCSNIVINIVVVSMDPMRQSCLRCKAKWARRDRKRCSFERICVPCINFCCGKYRKQAEEKAESD